MTQRRDIGDLFAQAAGLASGYRGAIDEASTPPMDYAAMLAAFDLPTPEAGAPAEAVIADLATRAQPGLRAMTGGASSAGLSAPLNPLGWRRIS